MALAKRLPSVVVRLRTTPSAFHGVQNLIVQALGIGMIGLTAMLTLPGRLVAGWMAATAVAALIEDRLLERAANAPAGAPVSARLAAVMRVLVTTLFALAALSLIAKGQGGDKLFGFAIISAALVHVLMRHYRSPLILAASLVPWVGILGLVGVGLARTALHEGQVLRAVAQTFVIAMLAIEFWSARQQLSAAWRELNATLAGVRRAEASLQETQRIAKIGSWRQPLGGARPEWSDELYEIFGLDAADGPPAVERMMERLDDDGRERLASLLAGEHTEAFSFSLRLQHTDGSERCCWVEGRPELDADGRPVGLIGFCQDVTDRETAAAQLRQAQKMESVGQLTGGLAHDFNNLLAVIIGNLDLISGDLQAGSLEKEFADTALEAALKGSELTKQLLAFSRRQTLDPKVVDLNTLVEGMGPLWRRTLGETVTVKLALAGDLWRTKLDPAQMESSLLNLVINARDAMPDGGVLTVETTNATVDPDNPELPPGDYAVVAVSDTGSGIPPELLAKVVEPFFTTKGVGQGSGLGLSMIYGFAKQSGGQLRIYSEVGHGTTVRLYLPRSNEAIEAAKAPAAGPVKGRGERVLVVEDNVDVRRVAVRQLTELGYQVLEADSGAAGLEALAADHGVDLVFSDIVMPGGMTGIEMIAAARETRPDLKALFTTGFTSAATANNNRVTGADMVISKPYRVTELAAKLREALAVDAAPAQDPPASAADRRSA
ncbi:ATP-binding protein [Phenylobacterium sp.]|uniref:ATP-binding protein n=1 Tax=Phenylobacterium sp. TaxID=1871053 RepID=UPI00122B58AE|nr:ATP-binding protein [Phenylobacterium sp.]THD59125.1 MAG: response regulator [Phenylobacterium sp.]